MFFRVIYANSLGWGDGGVGGGVTSIYVFTRCAAQKGHFKQKNLKISNENLKKVSLKISIFLTFLSYIPLRSEPSCTNILRNRENLFANLGTEKLTKIIMTISCIQKIHKSQW